MNSVGKEPCSETPLARSTAEISSKMPRMPSYVEREEKRFFAALQTDAQMQMLNVGGVDTTGKENVINSNKREEDEEETWKA